MTLAKEVNKKLDELLFVQSQIDEVENDLIDNTQLNNIETGEIITKENLLNKGREQLDQIRTELDEITNQGKNCRDIFTNIYYINDLSQDKLIAEEIRLNKMEKCLAKQDNPENN